MGGSCGLPLQPKGTSGPKFPIFCCKSLSPVPINNSFHDLRGVGMATPALLFFDQPGGAHSIQGGLALAPSHATQKAKARVIRRAGARRLLLARPSCGCRRQNASPHAAGRAHGRFATKGKGVAHFRPARSAPRPFGWRLHHAACGGYGAQVAALTPKALISRG